MLKIEMLTVETVGALKPLLFKFPGAVSAGLCR